MNFYDYLILALVGVWLLIAIARIISRRKKGICCNCSNENCEYRNSYSKKACNSKR